MVSASNLGGSISVHDGCDSDVFVSFEQYCSCTARMVSLLESGWLRRLCRVVWHRFRLYCNIAIRRGLLFIEICAFDVELHIINSLDFSHSMWAIPVPCWEVVVAVGALGLCVFVPCAVFCGMSIAAFSTCLFSSALRCSMSPVLAFIALCELELWGMFLSGGESAVVVDA